MCFTSSDSLAPEKEEKQIHNCASLCQTEASGEQRNDPRHFSHKKLLLGKLESLSTASTKSLGSKLLLFFFFRPISPRTTHFHIFVNGIGSTNNTQFYFYFFTISFFGFFGKIASPPRPSQPSKPERSLCTNCLIYLLASENQLCARLMFFFFSPEGSLSLKAFHLLTFFSKPL